MPQIAVTFHERSRKSKIMYYYCSITAVRTAPVSRMSTSRIVRVHSPPQTHGGHTLCLAWCVTPSYCVTQIKTPTSQGALPCIVQPIVRYSRRLVLCFIHSTQDVNVKVVLSSSLCHTSTVPTFPSRAEIIPGIWCLCLLYTSPSPRDGLLSRMPSSA